MKNRIHLVNLAIHGEIFLDENGDRMLDVFRAVQDFSLPSALDSQIVNINEDSPESSALVFSDGIPEDSIIAHGQVELIAISVDESGDISISVDLSKKYIDILSELFDVILSHEDLHMTTFDLEYSIGEEFNDLAFSIDGPSSFEYTGVKLEDEDYSYIIQSSDSGEWLGREYEVSEQEDISEELEEWTTASIDTKQHFDVTESGDFISKRIKEVNESLREVLP